MILNTSNKKAITSFNALQEKLKKVHKGYYDYSKVIFTSMTTPVVITCPDHGDFDQALKVHLRGSGCQICGQNRTTNSITSNKKSFIDKATHIYGTFYTYEYLEYEKAKSVGIITCPIHGNFNKRLDHFLGGSSCPKCVTTYTGFNKAAPASVYYLEINGGKAYKIGITNRTVNERFTLKELQSIKVLHVKHYSLGEDAYTREQEILKTYADFKYTGPKLLESGNTELFSLDIFNNSYKDI